MLTKMSSWTSSRSSKESYKIVMIGNVEGVVEITVPNSASKDESVISSSLLKKLKEDIFNKYSEDNEDLLAHVWAALALLDVSELEEDIVGKNLFSHLTQSRRKYKAEVTSRNLFDIAGIIEPFKGGTHEGHYVHHITDADSESILFLDFSYSVNLGSIIPGSQLRKARQEVSVLLSPGFSNFKIDFEKYKSKKY